MITQTELKNKVGSWCLAIAYYNVAYDYVCINSAISSLMIRNRDSLEYATFLRIFADSISKGYVESNGFVKCPSEYIRLCLDWLSIDPKINKNVSVTKSTGKLNDDPSKYYIHHFKLGNGGEHFQYFYGDCPIDKSDLIDLRVVTFGGK